MLPVEQMFHRGASQVMHLSHNKIISVFIAYLLGDLSAYTHWDDAVSEMTTSFAGVFGTYFSLTYLSKLELYLGMVFAIHWPCFVNGLSICDIINSQPISCSVIF
jgi:Phosphoenolpyruvate synthase/pyruvate phosphate dikinase